MRPSRPSIPPRCRAGRRCAPSSDRIASSPARRRRRRPPGEARRPGRALGARARGVAPARGALRLGDAPRSARARYRHAPGDVEGQGCRALGARIRTPRGARRSPRRLPHARAARGAPLRLGGGDREQRGGSAHPRAEEEARSRRDPQRARHGLHDRQGRRLMSMRRRLLFWLLSSVLAGGLAAAMVVFFQARSEANDLFDYQLRQLALTLRDRTFSARELAEALQGEEASDFMIQVWGRDGKRLYVSHPNLHVPGAVQLGFSNIETPEGRWRVFAIQQRGLTIQVAQPAAVRDDLALAAAWRTLMPFLVALPLMGFLI